MTQVKFSEPILPEIELRIYVNPLPTEYVDGQTFNGRLERGDRVSVGSTAYTFIPQTSLPTDAYPVPFLKQSSAQFLDMSFDDRSMVKVPIIPDMTQIRELEAIARGAQVYDPENEKMYQLDKTDTLITYNYVRAKLGAMWTSHTVVGTIQNVDESNGTFTLNVSDVLETYPYHDNFSVRDDILFDQGSWIRISNSAFYRYDGPDLYSFAPLDASAEAFDMATPFFFGLTPTFFENSVEIDVPFHRRNGFTDEEIAVGDLFFFDDRFYILVEIPTGGGDLWGCISDGKIVVDPDNPHWQEISQDYFIEFGSGRTLTVQPTTPHTKEAIVDAFQQAFEAAKDPDDDFNELNYLEFVNNGDWFSFRSLPNYYGEIQQFDIVEEHNLRVEFVESA